MTKQNVHISQLCLTHIIPPVLVVFFTSITPHVAVRLGGHSSPSGGVTVLPGTYPNPIVFYNHFVNKGEPLLMKGVLPDSGNKAYKLWTDEYLRETFGDQFVHVEKGKKENREQDVSAINFGKFLDIYQDVDLYMVYSASPTMQEDLEVPFTLQCGGFQDNIHDAVVWFSGGDTRSVLHYDEADNILCSLDGVKQVVLIDKKYAHRVMAHGFVEMGSYSLMDVDNVDEKSFADVLSLPWIQVNITAGDCLYIPYKWFHHVYSPPGRNLAVNTWFSHLWWFNRTDCEDVVRGTPSTPLNKVTLASPNEQLRTEFLEAYQDLEHITREEFIAGLRCEDDQDMQQMWDFINKGGGSSVTWPQLYEFSMDDLVAAFPQCFLQQAQMEDVDIQDEDTAQPEGKTADESKDTAANDAATGRMPGFLADEDLEEGELEEINEVFGEVYKDKKLEDQLLNVIDDIQEEILNDYGVKEADIPSEKFRKVDENIGAKVTEPTIPSEKSRKVDENIGAKVTEPTIPSEKSRKVDENIGAKVTEPTIPSEKSRKVDENIGAKVTEPTKVTEPEKKKKESEGTKQKDVHDEF